MPKFSGRSKARLDTCHPDLQKVMNAVVEIFDISVLEGLRDEATQNEYQRQGKSRLRWPNSKHNSEAVPPVSHAVDIAPYIPGIGIDWNNEKMFHYMAGIVMAVAHSLNIKIRWGGDWNRNQYSGDEKFLDMVHFELDEL